MGKGELNYNSYWQKRRLGIKTQLNSFQKKRADMALKYLKENSSIIDIGCGSGLVLEYINQRKSMSNLIGVDVSEDALNIARQKGIEVILKDISETKNLKSLPPADYIFLFEIIEHLPHSEDLLMWAVENAKKGIFFSVPNTGFFIHRLRLLLGRFPLQWRVYPSEHLRFWTLKDIKWWLNELNIKNYKLHLYEGFPVLNKLWPSLFGQGIFVYASAASAS